jgi:hypothetical protein
MCSVSEFLVVYPDPSTRACSTASTRRVNSAPEVVRRRSYYVSALLEGSRTPAAAAED